MGKLKILIAEDDRISGIMITSILKKYGKCEMVENGKEAFISFKNALRAGKPFDLICLDIMMPVMDGQKTLKKIRRLEEQKKITHEKAAAVIMITALDDKNSIFEAFNSQCSNYITKPVDGSKLIAKIKELGII